jgi:peptidoglycan/LPS O-acetylase OafA/YrhL
MPHINLSGPKYRKDIQAFRGLAVISVVLFHASDRIFPNGYLGVDVFFVISGFLITPRLIGTNGLHLSNKNLRLKLISDFFISRFLRLAPAASFSLLFTLILMVVFEPPRELGRFASQALSYLLLTGNIGAGLFAGNYFNPTPNPLLHLWSLSAEEQFYLIIPICLYLATFGRYSSLSTRVREKQILCWIGLLSLLSFITIRTIEFNNPNTPGWLRLFNFYSPTSRLWEFCLGSAAYFFSNKLILVKLLSLFQPLAFLSLTLIILWPQSLSGIGPEIAVPFLTSAMLMLRSQIFQSFYNPLSKVGDISYSLYLIHLPLLYIAFFSPLLIEAPSRKLLKAFAVGASFFIALFMKRLIEDRYRNLNKGVSHIDNKHLLGLVLKFQVLPVVLFVAIILASQNYYWGLDRNSKPLMSPLALDENCFKDDRTSPCILESGGSTPVLLVGDSHAEHLSMAFRRASIEMNFTPFVWAKNGCQFILPSTAPKENKVLWSAWGQRQISESESCFEHNLRIMKYVKNNPGLRIFVTHRSTAYPVHDFQVTSKDWNSLVIRNLFILKQNGAKVILVGPNPEFPDYSKFFMGQTMFWQENYEDSARRSYSIHEMNPFPQIDDKQLARALTKSGINYISTISTFCHQAECSRYANGEWLYTNADHLSLKGSLKLVSKLKQGF